MYDEKMMKKMALKKLMMSLMDEDGDYDDSGMGEMEGDYDDYDMGEKKCGMKGMKGDDYDMKGMKGDYDDYDMKKKPKIKATLMADSKEGLIEGAKKLPEILSKADEYMKGRMSELDEYPMKKKKKK